MCERAQENSGGGGWSVKASSAPTIPKLRLTALPLRSDF
jgi:hypothetical protein